MTLAELFAAIAADASALDCLAIPGHPETGPAAIHAYIRDTTEPWPGGGSGEPVSGGGMSDPTMRDALGPIIRYETARDRALRDGKPPPRSGDYIRPDKHPDIGKLERAIIRFVQSIRSIGQDCWSTRPPETWDEAVHAADQLHQGGYVTAALDVGRRIAPSIYRAHEALAEMKRIRDGHCPHAPDGFDKLGTGDPICLSHARIGDYDRPRHGKVHICRVCYDIISLVADPSEVHNDPDWWPADDLLREHAIMESTGKRVDYKRERAMWVERKTVRRSA